MKQFGKKLRKIFQRYQCSSFFLISEAIPKEIVEKNEEENLGEITIEIPNF